jgi:hypothetical protein
MTPTVFASLAGVDLLQADASMRNGLPVDYLRSLSTHHHPHLDGLVLCGAGLLLDPTVSDESDVASPVAVPLFDVEVEDGELSDDDLFIPGGVKPSGGDYIEPADGLSRRRPPVPRDKPLPDRSAPGTGSDSDPHSASETSSSEGSDSDSHSVSDTSSSDGDVNDENRDRFGDVAKLVRAGPQTSDFCKCPENETPDLVAVCRDCVRDLTRGELPVCALANHNVWGEVPAQLQGLSCSEEMLISLVRHRIYVRYHHLPPVALLLSLIFRPSVL